MVVNNTSVPIETLLAITKVVVNNKIVVVTISQLTTTLFVVVRKMTTKKSLWSLLPLTTEAITTTNDHPTVVVNDF